MKQINIKELKVREVTLVPDGDLPLSVLYELKDDAGATVMTKRVNVKKEDMPVQATTALNNLVERITTRISTLEAV